MSRSQQEETVLRAIVISSSMAIGGQVVPHYDRQTAFQVLTEFKNFDGRIPMCLSWLQQESIRTHNNHTRLSSSSIHNSNNNNSNGAIIMEENITVPTKLFALDVLSDFLTKRYSSLRPEERLALRQAVLTAARQLAPTRSDVAEARILGNKLATLLAGLIVRDFPQRWTSLMDDVFGGPVVLPNGRGGGLWCTDINNNNNNNSFNNSSSSLINTGASEDQSTMGVKICLEVLKLVAEDCTDSDFNAKVRYFCDCLAVYYQFCL
jgi:hypothetical protein